MKYLFIAFAFLLSLQAHSQTALDYAKKGYAKFVADDYAGAIMDLNKAIEAKPALERKILVGTYLMIGSSKRSLKDYTGAIQVFSKGIELEPMEGQFYAGRGLVKFALSDYDGAIQDLTKAIELNPDDEESRKLLKNASDLKILSAQLKPLESNTTKQGVVEKKVTSNKPIVKTKPKPVIANPVKQTQSETGKTFTDSRNGKLIKSTKIANQTWMVENLDVDKFRDGSVIPEARTAEQWNAAGDQHLAAWCYFDNNPENGKKYGRMYNYFAIMDPRGLAPQGWHVPSDVEWTTLTDSLKGLSVAGKKMKASNGWDIGNGSNDGDFAGLPGGYLYCRNMSFKYLGTGGYWWTTTESSIGAAYYRGLTKDSDAQSRYDSWQVDGMSVRCIKD